jgi:hypothetical protein
LGLVRLSVSVAALSALLASAAAHADPPCRTVEIGFKPAKNLQIAVWIEDAAGNYQATAFVTRLTGTFGLANRPGNHFLHSRERFPYGRRDMVLPVWAHERNHSYGLVVMGGAIGNSEATCAAHATAGDCDDDTIAYHSAVSSLEPFYCSPTGAMITQQGGIDVVSCASTFIGSKGAYATDGRVSLYPPRADLTRFGAVDSADAQGYAGVNDLGAVSGATPQREILLDPPIRWRPPADGRYVAKIEVSQESDFNASHSYPQAVDSQNGAKGGYDFNLYGHDFLGQPSVVYAVPFTVGDMNDEQVTSSYAGYGDWDGATGTLHPADASISDTPGSGAGRLLDVSDGGKSFRVRVRTTQECSTAPSDGGTGNECHAPDPPTGLVVTPNGTTLDVRFASATSGVPTARFDVRYRDTPISDADFYTAAPSDEAPPQAGTQGSTVTSHIHGLIADKSYFVAVRAISSCEAASTVTAAKTQTGLHKFATLHGCFIATAAYGTPLAAELDALRSVRDRVLLTNPLGRLAVASYYALSPPLARAIASDERLRAGTRALLAPVVAVARAGLRAEAAHAALTRSALTRGKDVANQ